MRAKGHTLVHVPCWWAGEPDSLVQTILFHRPELEFCGFRPTDPIPLNPPHSFFTQYGIPDIGELMLASFPSDRFNEEISPQNPWWVGEKYDGIRVCWHPGLRHLYARSGLHIPLPGRIKRFFSRSAFMDCEIWFGRGEFPDAVKLVHHDTHSSVPWPYLRALTFDDASPLEERYKFEDRYSKLLALISRKNPIVIQVSRMRCDSKMMMDDLVHQVVSEGGEGLVARKPKSIYEHGRSQQLFKIKASRGDKEALLVEVEPDYFTLQLPDGITFKVETTDFKFDKFNKPKPGDVVTFTYENYSRRAAPIKPKLQRIRGDISWEEVLSEYEMETGQIVDADIRKKFTARPQRFWNADKGKNMRALLEGYAKNRQMDPLVPENWYSIRSKHILENVPGYSSLVAYFSNIPQAVMALFPEIGLDESKFEFHKTMQRWQDIAKRREFFVDFSVENNFDPMVAENWHTISVDALQDREGADSLLHCYKGSVGRALAHLFPDVGIDESFFPHFTPEHWKEPENRRIFFEEYAKKNDFDPLTPANWYNLSFSILMREKNAGSIFSYHNGSYSQALLDLFPEIGLNLSKFAMLPRIHWHKRENRKQFFMRFAELKKIDPLIPSNWYNVTTEELLRQKGAGGMLDFYNGSFMAALLDNFPDIGLEKHKLHLPKKYWKEEYSRRKFFDGIAKHRGFDPLKPKNWYFITPSIILKYKGANGVLAHYKNNYVKALMSLYPNIGLDKMKFDQLPYNHWNDAENKREVFRQVAKEMEFDPLIASNWYSVRTDSIFYKKGARAILAQHGNFVQALCDLFPNVKFDKPKFLFLTDYQWKQEHARKEFFVKFAHEQGFDPLVPENWYSVTQDMFANYPDAQAMIQYYYKGNFVTALVELFSDLPFDSSKFLFPPKFWVNVENRRKFLAELAAQKGFDPEKAENWYSLSQSDLVDKKGMSEFLGVYNWDLGKAITSLFPSVEKINATKLPSTSRSFWKIYRDRRAFENFAKKRGFDPLVAGNWLKVRNDAAYSKKIGALVKLYGSFKKAFASLFPELQIHKRN
eukprot:Phypoly_transcript_01349.p1 GENE.Phypoly_transcript_01349~~Phypoly_transcript_01349.p1  ORF type:complete len:1107 (+),score=164.22 Phypoly_transcript_01349:191-3322(+)